MNKEQDSNSKNIFKMYVSIGTIHFTELLTNSLEQIVKSKQHLIKEFDTLQSAISSFLKEDSIPFAQVVLYIATPGLVKHHNLLLRDDDYWTGLSAEGLRTELGLSKVLLLNDAEAACYKFRSLDSNRFVALKAGPVPDFSQDFKVLQIILGRRLGGCLMSQRGGRFQCVSSEVGHSGMGCIDSEHFEFEQYLREVYQLAEGEFVHVERCVSSYSIPLLYEFYLKKAGRQPPSPQVEACEIFALKGTDPEAHKTYVKFLKLLGTCLMTIASAFLPDDGIVVHGLMLASIVEYIQQDTSNPETSIFLKAFLNNRCVRNYLSSVPIFFTSEADLSLKGAQEYSRLN